MSFAILLKIGGSTVDHFVSDGEAACPWTVFKELEPFILKMRSWKNLSSRNLSSAF